MSRAVSYETFGGPEVRDDPLALGLFLDSLAASTALASRMLLVMA